MTYHCVKYIFKYIIYFIKIQKYKNTKIQKYKEKIDSFNILLSTNNSFEIINKNMYTFASLIQIANNDQVIAEYKNPKNDKNFKTFFVECYYNLKKNQIFDKIIVTFTTNHDADHATYMIKTFTYDKKDFEITIMCQFFHNIVLY